jgi:hypothetical protein
MTTRRKKSKAIARTGANYVRMVVEKYNHIFHEIDLDNDLGNDAYVEFIESEEATGSVIATQIKAGRSYFRHDPDHAIVQSDRNHFEYWHSHSLPIAMIVYDPDSGSAAWLDITELLMHNPKRIESGPYTIHIPASRVFDENSFASFYSHFVQYRELYRVEGYFGRALQDFANTENPESCFDGLFSLFSFHRNRVATWYYLISCFRNFCGHPMLRDLIGVLCHVPGHPDIFWHRRNIIESATQAKARKLLGSHFGRDDVVLLLSQIDEDGIARGTIGQAIHAIVDAVHGRDAILDAIAFDPSLSTDVRYWAVVLLADYEQRASRDPANVLARYLRIFPNDDHNDLI